MRARQLRLEHLVSYEGMGVVRLECLGGCACSPQRIDAHRTSHIRNVSVFDNFRFAATKAVPQPTPLSVAPVEASGAAAAGCELTLTVLEETSSQAHKFKVRSVTVTSAPPEAAEPLTDEHGEANAPLTRNRRGGAGQPRHFVDRRPVTYGEVR